MIILDTHALIWTTSADRRMGRGTAALINRWWPSGRVAVSAISFWEIALLVARDRLDLPELPAEWRTHLIDRGWLEFPVTGAVGIRAVDLGDLPDDPADRLIVATALVNNAELVTADEKILAWRHPLVRHDARK